LKVENGLPQTRIRLHSLFLQLLIHPLLEFGHRWPAMLLMIGQSFLVRHLFTCLCNPSMDIGDFLTLPDFVGASPGRGKMFIDSMAKGFSSPSGAASVRFDVAPSGA